MTMFTAEQHRWMAANLLKTAGTPGHPTVARAKQMAENHETMARMIERRAARMSAALTRDTLR
jgi:hypothetical protein